jgi:hypothetical protein
MGVPVRYFPGACCLKSCLLRNARIYSDRRLLQAAVPVPRSASGHSSFGRRLSLRLLALSSSDVEVGSRLGSPISLQYGCRRWRRWGYSVGSRPCFLLRRPALSARLLRRLWTWVDVAGHKFGGEGGIRTPDTVARMPHFECGAIDHSATSPWPHRAQTAPSVGRYVSKAARRDKGAAASSSVRLIRCRRGSDLGPSCSHGRGHRLSDRLLPLDQRLERLGIERRWDELIGHRVGHDGVEPG